MSVTKLKPTRTPRMMDEWAEQKASACKEATRISQDAIEKSKKLVEQSKEIQSRLASRLKTGRDRRTKAS